MKTVKLYAWKGISKKIIFENTYLFYIKLRFGYKLKFEAENCIILRKINYPIIFIILMMTSFASKLLFDNYKLKNRNNLENIDIEELTSSLNECFDLENKNERSLVESIRLIEYCLNIHDFD